MTDHHETLVDAGFLLDAVDAIYERSYGSAWVAFSDPAWSRARNAANRLRASLAAQAIEARRAATENTDAVHESAVGEADAPTPSINQGPTHER